MTVIDPHTKKKKKNKAREPVSGVVRTMKMTILGVSGSDARCCDGSSFTTSVWPSLDPSQRLRSKVHTW